MNLNNEQLTGQDDSHIHWLDEHTGVHLEMLSAWHSLCDSAKIAGFNLAIASGYRSFARQLNIWNRKFTGQLPIKNLQGHSIDIDAMTDTDIVNAILLYSALPGASRHHWGCDIDIYASNLLPEDQKLQLEPWEYQEKGPFHSLSQWLSLNAHLYGFYRPYDKFRGGVALEPWHLSYWPLAKKYEEQLSSELLNKIISLHEIKGKVAITSQLSEIFTTFVKNTGSINNE
jgi:LAS superfamily LD-carboxypeptidase LdcB